MMNYLGHTNEQIHHDKEEKKEIIWRRRRGIKFNQVSLGDS